MPGFRFFDASAMIRYVFRRLLQAIPTVAGVVLVTFVLFQVVGGSPAAMVLGQNAGAASLEEFDAAHGYNKPLFFGNWAPTRALESVTFDENTPPSVRAKWGAEGDGPLRLEAGEELKVPFAFELPAGENWRLTVEWADAKSFPTIGKIFSNHWKNRTNFPTIGKKFSNHWKIRVLPMGRQIVQWAGCVRRREMRSG